MPGETPLNALIDQCAREPIHVPGSIQPHGALVACGFPSWTVTHVSENAPAVLGKAGPLLGQPLDALFSSNTVHDLRNALQASMVSGTAEVLPNISIGGHRTADFVVHLSKDHVVVEVIPQDGAQVVTSAPLALVRSMVGRLKKAPTLERALTLAANQIRAVTGFDRVMVYKFLDDGSGEVLAEALRAGLEPYLGLRYPASDIPPQARKLFLHQFVRLIPDVDYTPSVLLSSEAAPAALDLSLSSLRSVSPVHIEYLRNMGSGATLTISLVTRDKLWGLIACHHEVPRRPATSTCSACEMFGQVFSLQIEAQEQQRELSSIARSKEAHERLIASMPPEETLFDNLSRYGEMLKELIPCDGVGVWTTGVLSGIGNIPPVEAMPDLVAFLGQQDAQQVYAANSLSAVFPPAAAYADRVSGLIAIPFSRAPRDYLLFFRQEILQVVKWGGDPNKPVEVTSGNLKLGPRRSFAAWSEQVRQTGAPWRDVELKIAEALRTSLMDVILRRADLVERERRSAQESQALLIAELNHRVKNILALIRSLVRQSRQGARSITSFTADLEHRIQALSLAHDQITQAGWSAAPLRRLLEAEAKAWASNSRDGVTFSGPEVLLDSRAYQTMALVFHELMTNAAKYGALSVPAGKLTVAWTIRDDGAAEISWQEAGGPTVSPPTRRGFGTVVVEQTVPFELQGVAQVDYDFAGVRARFVIPGALVTVGPEPVPSAKTGDRIETVDLLGKRLLLVEDSMMIALDAQSTLQSADIEVEVVGSVSDAMRAVELERLDAAILDINLSGETSFGIADRCVTRNMPFVFATGYGENVVLPDRFKTVPIVSKPYDVDALRAALGRVTAGVGGL